METPESNNLPMLPDPLESQPTPALSTASNAPVVNQPAPAPTNKPHRNYLRMGLIFGGVAVVLLLVLFGSRLADLLNLRGSKAGEAVNLNQDTFFSADWESVPANSFQIVNGSLMLSSPGQ